MLFISCVCHAFASVHCCLVVTCWEGTGLLALVCDVKLCFVTFQCGIPGQVRYLIVSIPDLCRLSYFNSQSHMTAMTAMPVLGKRLQKRPMFTDMLML